MVLDSNPQLYTFLEGLRVINDRDERGLVLGYSLAQSLLTTPLTSRRQQLQHDEVRAVYHGLEEAVSRCRNSPSSSPSSNPAYDYLCELRQVVDPLIERLKEAGSQTSVGKNSLQRAVGLQLQKSRNPQDRLRRDGLGLMDSSIRRGRIYGQGNILRVDYDLLKETFRA